MAITADSFKPTNMIQLNEKLYGPHYTEKHLDGIGDIIYGIIVIGVSVTANLPMGDLFNNIINELYNSFA